MIIFLHILLYEYQNKVIQSRAGRVIRQNDVIISTVRPNLKAFAYIDFTIKDTIVSTGFAVLSPKDMILTKYLYYLFYTELLLNHISQVVRGTSYPAMNIDDMEKFIFPLPPLAEQERIVAKIEEIKETIDEIE